MQRQDLEFTYPENLIATERAPISRIVLGSDEPREISRSELFDLFHRGDILVINDTKIERRRVFSGDLEILFVTAKNDIEWEVLFPARDLKIGDQVALPGGVTMQLMSKGLPQQVRLSHAIGPRYFEQYGEPALPPYIQKARGERHARPNDHLQYQSAWAEVVGSSAAPTASLHFDQKDLHELKSRGVDVATLTLHVGLGTFLPIKTDNLDEHQMHKETVHISAETVAQIQNAQRARGHIWALGTTVTRALESMAAGYLQPGSDGDFWGETDLFIKPGFEFQVVDGLLTNFHQPGSTLLALVGAFAGLETVKNTYQWAIDRQFRLFSYGDLTVWRRYQ